MSVASTPLPLATMSKSHHRVVNNGKIRDAVLNQNSLITCLVIVTRSPHRKLRYRRFDVLIVRQAKTARIYFNAKKQRLNFVVAAMKLAALL